MNNIFEDIESVIYEPLKFKAKLAIGEDAYTTLRLKNKIQTIWDTAGAAGTGAAIAKSSAVAATFFAPQGILGILGVGAAITPIGWVAAAGLLTGGAWFGVMHYLKDATRNRVDVIPKFINTPLDILAINLFDSLGPLALKIAIIDGEICEQERSFIKNYFIEVWGYEKNFIEKSLALIELNINSMRIQDISDQLAKLQKNNPDCNYKVMSTELIEFLKGIMMSDGIIDEREEIAIEKIQSIFMANDQGLIIETLSSAGEKLNSVTTSAIECAHITAKKSAKGVNIAAKSVKAGLLNTIEAAESFFKLVKK